MRVWLLVTLPLSMIILPAHALAYIGPGLGLSALGSLLALVAGVVLAIVGFIWYPVKRILHRRRTKRDEKQEENTAVQ